METDAQSDFQARVTPWFIRRMSLVILMCFGLGGWFLYDGHIGYPKAQEWHETWQEMKGTPEGMAEWREISRRNKVTIINDNTLEPKTFTDEQIRNQSYYAIVCGVLGGMALVWLLVHFRRSIVVDDSGITLPSGRHVPYGAIRRLDTTRWKNKGLATLHYELDGEEKKGVIDGLKYGGFRKPAPYAADILLERVLDRFEGELIELEEDEEDEEDGEREGETVDEAVDEAGAAGSK